MRDAKLLPSLEGLRFIASMAVVANHFIPYAYADIRIERLSVAVDLFFVISGIVIANQYQGRMRSLADYADFLQRRLARIYPLHLATLLFYVVIGLLLSRGLLHVNDPDKYRFSLLLLNALLIQAWNPFDYLISFNRVSWSISAEFFVYLLFPLIAWIIGRGFGVAATFVSACLALGVGVAYFVYNIDLVSLNWQFGIIRALPGFALGVLLSTYREEIAAVLRPDLARTSVHVLLALLPVLMLADSYNYILLPLAYALVACAFVCDISRTPTVAAWEPLSSLGYLTYSIYMLHPLVATVFLTAIAPKLLGTSMPMMFVAVGIGTLITLGLSVLSYRYFEQPMRQRINALSLTPRAAAAG